MAEDWDEHLRVVRKRKAEAHAQGGPEALGRLHSRGKLSARERLELLLEPGSFREIGSLVQGTVETPGRAPVTVQADGVVTGWGEVAGRRVFVAADDGSVMGGAAGLLNVEKRFRVRRMALAQGVPFIGLYEGSAIRFQDSMDAAVMSRVPAFKEVVDCAGAIPQVAAVLGPCFGRPPMDVLLSDFAVMVRGTGLLGWSGPTLVRGGIGETVDLETLAGAKMQAEITGLVDRVEESEAECLALIRQFLSFMPTSCWELPPHAPDRDDPKRPCPELLEIVPTNLRRPYDMHRVVAAIVDRGEYLTYKPTFGRAIITCLARLGGRPVGIVASQPAHEGGVIDCDAAYKTRRFIAVCDAFHVPLIFLQDQPGFMIGQAAEAHRAIYWCGSLLATVERTTVPKLTIILRKSHGAATWAMGGRSGERPDLLAAWPLALLTGTGPASAVLTIHDKELRASDRPADLRRTLEAQYRERGSILRAAAVFGVDDVIEPQDTRAYLAAALDMACSQRARALGRKASLFP